MTDTLAQLRTAIAARYLIERELGRGGMATVYLARDVKHERMVAVKVLDPALSSNLGPDRFLREIRLAAGLQHPNILGVYDSGEADGLMYFVMPFVEGESLRDRLKREQQLPIEEAVRIAQEVADALTCAHSRGIIHRDIKPENILLSGGHAVVADFGIARALSEAGDKLTQTGMAIGTPAYMSPEQASGETATLDGRSDVYSLACVLYEMLSGQPPFTGPSSRAIMAQHSMENVPSLQILRQSIPDELEDAIFRALEKVPADRFATANQFSKALNESSISSLPRPSRARTARTGRHTRERALTGWKKYRWSALAAIPLGAALAWYAASRSGAASADQSDPGFGRIAVMYFEDQTGGRLSHVAEGFTDALIHDLSGVGALKVISRNGVLPFRGRSVPPDSVARMLDVGTLVDGTVQEAGDQIRVTVSLINALTGEEIDHKSLERPRADLLALQDDITSEVSIFLRQRVGQEIQLSQRRAETDKVAAWETFQQAQEIEDDVQTLLAANDIPAAAVRLKQADSALAVAEEQDRDWIRPVVKRGWIAYRQARLPGGFNREAMPQHLEQATTFAERALAVEPRDADALELRGTVRYLTWLLNLVPDGEEAPVLHQGAQQDLEASVAANPNQAGAWSTLSHLRMGASQNAMGKLAALKAYEADRFLAAADQIIWRLFQSSLDLEDQQESKRWCNEGARRFPADPRFTECRLWLSTLPGSTPDIGANWQQLAAYEQLTPQGQRDLAGHKGRMLVAMALARAGMADSARNVARSARSGSNLDPTRDLALYEAIVQTILADQDEAIRLLSVYLATNPHLRRSLANDDSWYFRDLRANPRYQSMIGSTKE